MLIFPLGLKFAPMGGKPSPLRILPNFLFTVLRLSVPSLTRLLRGTPPGPEGSVPKLQWAEANQWLQELAVDMQSARAQLYQGEPSLADDAYWQYGFLHAKANSIEGRTSEIQRNIIAERGQCSEVQIHSLKRANHLKGWDAKLLA